MIYLNHASIGLPYSVARTATEEFLNHWENPRFRYPIVMLGLVDNIKNKLAKLLHTEPSNFAIVPNTALGFSLILNAHKFNNNDEILILDNEFPSNAYPYMALKDKGVIVTQIPASEFYQNPIDTLKKYTSKKTIIFALSLVSYNSGYKANVKDIAAYCKNSNIRLYIDGTQGIGVTEVNLSDCHVDVLVTSGYKWLRWPIGTAFAYIHPSYITELNPTSAGWLSSNDRPNTSYPLYLEFPSSARKFEQGGTSFLGLKVADASLSELLDIGISTIESELKLRTNRILDHLKSRKLNPSIDYDIYDHAGIISFSGNTVSQEAYMYLISQDIWITFRNGYFRLSPQYDTPLEHIDSFFLALDTFSTL